MRAGSGGGRPRPQRAALRHGADLRLRGRGLAGREPQLHRLWVLRRRPGLRLPQRLGPTLQKAGQHVRPTLAGEPQTL